MKKILCGLMLVFSLCANSVFAAMVEDWSALTNSNTGTYADSTGSKIEFEAVDGPSGNKALQITSTMVQGGYCGIWHNLSGDLSKQGSLKFKAKSTVAGEGQMTLLDAFHVQYVASFQVGKDWAEVTVPFASFHKDTSYTPPGAIQGHPMDLSSVSGMNFSPHMGGSTVFSIGPVEAVEGGAAPAASAAASGPGLAQPILIQNFSSLPAKDYGTFQDTTGSKFKVEIKGQDSKKFLVMDYTLVQGGYCGLWCRAGGSDWQGVSIGAAKSIILSVFCKESVVMELALKDKNNNQYVAQTPATKGGSWEVVTVPLDSFNLDPYYTPPDAVKGAPKDFSMVKTFNIQPQTVGTFSVAVNNVAAK